MDDTADLGSIHSTRSVKVEIYNQSYSIRGESDPEYISQLADFVDRRMRDVAAATHTVDSLKVAILTALHIADEFHQLKDRHDQLDRQITGKADQVGELIDQALRVRDDSNGPEETIGRSSNPA